MSKNGNKSGNAHKWFPLLMAVLALLAIIANKNNNDGNYSGNASVGTQQSRPSDRVLAAVPAELRDNYFLARKEMGCCKTLSGDVAVTVVMVSDSVGKWDAESISNLKIALEANAKDIIAEANTYQVELSFSFHYYKSTMTGDVCGGENDNEWQDKALKAAGLPELSNLHDYLTEKYSSKEAPVVFVFNKSGRAFAITGTDEHVVLYNRNDYDAFQHELSHVFGARDFYYPEDVKTLAMTTFPDSIMHTGETADPLTAYVIGWTDSLSDSTLQFLRDTNEMSVEEIKDSQKNQMITGYGTRDFDNGTYTGDMVRGERHGTGKMQYDNGGWYEGEWNYGAMSGTGTGKIIYENGSVYEGDFLNGKYHGSGKLQYANGGWYKGQWKEGSWSGSGEGKIIYESGSVYEGNFQNGKYHGEGKMQYADGSWYDGQWKEGSRSGYGEGKIVHDNGDVYEGELLNGQRHGQGTYYYANGGLIKGGWSNGAQSGDATGKQYYDNGYYEGQFYNGKRHGQGTYVWSNGNKYTGQWTNGERTGYGTLTYADGTVRTGNWQNGKFVG